MKIRNKNGIQVTLKISSNVIGDSNDENNFPHKLLLTKTLANNSWANLKSSKTQLRKIGQSGGFLGRLLGLLLKTGLPLIGHVLNSLARSILIPLRLTVAAAATDADIHKKCLDLVLQN